MEASEHKADARWARTRERLLEGGRIAFAEKGVEGASVLDIVRAAGVSQPSFYNHFKSKQELAGEIAAGFFRNDREVKAAVFAEVEDPAEAIAINIFHTLAIANDDPVIAWTLLKSETLRELVISSDYDPLADMIAAGIKSGRFAEADPGVIALAIRGGAFAVLQDMLKNANPTGIPAYQQLVLRMLGLEPAESIAVVERAQQRYNPEAAA